MRNHLSTIVWKCSQLVLSFGLAIGVAHAQSGAGSGLAGRVADSSGASMAGVTVTVSRPDTGSERTTTTNASGDWEARFLQPGAYSIAFEHRGIQDAAPRERARHDRSDGGCRRRPGSGKYLRGGSGERRCTNGVGRLGRNRANARSEGARGAADIGPQHYAVARDRARRICRHQRAALERQRVDLAERQRRPHDEQQLRVQRHRRHEHAVLQQPHQRIARHDRRRRRHAVAKHRARAGNARGSEAADQHVRRLGRPKRRRHLPGGLEERHEHAVGHGLSLHAARQAAGERFLLQSRRHGEAAAAAQRRRPHGRRTDQTEPHLLLRLLSEDQGGNVVRRRSEQHRAASTRADRRPFERGHRQVRVGHLEYGALRTGESGRHQSDFAVASSGEAAERYVPGAVGLQRVQLRQAIESDRDEL